VRITDRDDINHAEAARIGRIAAVAALRGGVLTTKQQNTIDRILAAAKKREDKKRAEQAAK
jgi:hypothetical protein